MAGWQDDPVVAPATKGGSWQNDPVVGGDKGVTAQTPSDYDYSNSPWSALGRTFESSATWGVGDLIRAAATGKKPSETAAQSSAAAASLPWYIRYPTEAAGYGLGLVNLLDPATDAVEAGVAGLAGGKGLLSAAAKTATEGATAGAVSHVAGSDDPTLAGTAGAALGGAALGGAAGAAGPLVNKGLTKAFGKPGSIDPAFAEAQTAQKAAQTYAQGQQFKMAPADMGTAISGPMGNLDPSVETGLSSAYKTQYNDIRQALINQHNQGKQIDANMVDSWQRQLDNAVTPGSTDGVVNGQISDNLNQLLKANGADKWQQSAKTAFQQSKMAENLGLWQRTLQAGGSLGQKPLTEAERFYDPGSPEYQTLAGLANQGSYDHGIGWMLPHLASHVLGMGGYAVAGLPGSVAGELAGLGLRKPINQALKGYKQRGQIASLQQAYPQMTGMPLTGATTGPQVGDQIKNLMMGATY